jgi:putative heme transporter
VTTSVPVRPEPPPPEPEGAVPDQDAAAVRRPRWRLLRVLAALATVAVLVVLALVHGRDVRTALAALRAPAPPWVVAAVLVEAVSMGLYARMQRRLLRGAGTRVPLHRAVTLAYAAHSMSITLPGGPLVSTVYNYRRMRAFGADSTVAAWATAASGVLSSLGLVALTTALGVAFAADDADDVVPLAVAATVVAVVAGAGALLRRRPGWRAALAGRSAGALARIPAAHRRRVEQAVSWTGRLLQVRIPPRHLAMAGAHSVGNWVADATCLALCCAALGVHVSPVPLGLTYVAGMTASSLPIVPGGLGTVDGALALGLVAAGVRTSPALAVVVLYRLITVVLIGGIGWALWLLGRGRRRREATAPTAG